FFGPNQDQAILSSALFASSAHGRVRVRINDGFNETTAISDVFVAAGTPPVVRINSPVADSTIRSGALLYLSGKAYDEYQMDISANDLAWYAGTTLLGTGEVISASGLPVGMDTIQLVARDSQGRISSQSVAVNIVP